jgi:hypothetical protein
LIFGGITNVELAEESFDLGAGVRLERTFANLTSINLMTFAQGKQGQHPPGPYKAANGGFGYDISVEIQVPTNGTLPSAIQPRDAIWLIAALIRLAKCPYLMVPVISSHSFKAIAWSTEPMLEALETEMRLLRPVEKHHAVLDSELLTWIAQVWPPTVELMKRDARFDSAFRAFDLCTVRRRTSSSLLMVWGALEQLFAPSTSELRYRVSSNIAAYLNPAGEERLRTYREILDLYNHRSTAAHTAKDANPSALLGSYVLMRNSLLRMVKEQHVPSQTELEQAIFSPEPSPQ